MRRFSSEPLEMGSAHSLRYSSFALTCRNMARSSYDIPATGRGIVVYDEVWTLSVAERQLRAAFRREATTDEPAFATRAPRKKTRADSRKLLSSCMEGSGAVIVEEIAPRRPRRATLSAIQDVCCDLETAVHQLVRGEGHVHDTREEGQGLVP